MKGYKLDSTTHDLALDASGRFVSFADDDSAAVAQEIKTRLLFFKAENFEDLREGTPYFQEILKKGPDLNRVRAIIRSVIASVPAVLDVPRVSIVVDSATRAATIVWTARTRKGATIRSEDFQPLVIN